MVDLRLLLACLDRYHGSATIVHIGENIMSKFAYKRYHNVIPRIQHLLE